MNINTSQSDDSLQTMEQSSFRTAKFFIERPMTTMVIWYLIMIIGFVCILGLPIGRSEDKPLAKIQVLRLP